MLRILAITGAAGRLVGPMSAGVPVAETEAIEAAAPDCIEGSHTGDGGRIERSVRPEVMKAVSRDGRAGREPEPPGSA